MLKHKRIREKGKLSLRKYFQEMHTGQRIAIVRNLSYPGSFPRRLQGRTGVIIEERGNAFVVSLANGKKQKKFIVPREHIKKIKDKKGQKS